MDGMIKVSYTVMCKNDVNVALTLNDLLTNEKVAKAIKSEFATGLRNLTLIANDNSDINIKTNKEIFEFEVGKDDYADILEFAEEDARKHKRFKKECDGVELVNIETFN